MKNNFHLTGNSNVNCKAILKFPLYFKCLLSQRGSLKYYASTYDRPRSISLVTAPKLPTFHFLTIIATARQNGRTHNFEAVLAYKSPDFQTKPINLLRIGIHY